MLNQAAAVALRILLFRAGPQDFPFSPALTRTVVALALLTGFLQAQLILTTGQAVVHALASTVMLAMFTHTVLQLFGLRNRYQQTLNSLFAMDIALTPLLLGPVSVMAPYLGQPPEAARGDLLVAWAALAWLLLAGWHFIVSANIFRHALNTQMGVGALVAMVAVLVTVSFAQALTALVG